jgi:hypothetical protein
MQIENEYGFCGSDKDYLRHLVATARMHLGADVILYTTGESRFSWLVVILCPTAGPWAYKSDRQCLFLIVLNES